MILLTTIHTAAAQTPPGSAAAEAAGAGWRKDSGAARHEASTTTCPAALSGFDALIFIGPSQPNIIGTCTYKDGSNGGDIGLQVRRYIRDVGESPEAIQNDRVLMEPQPGANTPFMMVRFAEITTRDGKRGGRIVITKARGGFLVDCFGEGENLDRASQKVGLVCGQ